MAFNPFSKSAIPIEKQLSELAACGLKLTSGIGVEDLLLFDTREDIEKKPYEGLIAAMGFCTEDGEETQFCPRLWMCDYECIEDHHAYIVLILRLQMLSDELLPLSNIADYVDIDEGKAWIEFDLDGEKIHWDMAVEDDWLDPSIFPKYNQLLVEHTNLRIYSNQADFGQSALFGCFTKDEFERFRKLSNVKFSSI